MPNIQLIDGELVIDAPEGEIDVDAITCTVAASAAIESWEVEAGCEMSPEMMEFASLFFFAGYRLCRREGGNVA
jgi:hypothetical protein